MFKQILVPLDGSENAERVLPWLKIYAGPARSQIVLLRVVPNTYSGTQEPVEAELTKAHEYLRGIERQLNFEGVPAKVIISTGNAPAAIVRTAEATGCDLIIMATRGESTVGRWLIGGVTDQVMRLSPIPVFVVRSQMALLKQARVSRILVPLDGSTLSDTILPWSEQLARFHHARINFLHVFPEGTIGRRKKHEDLYQALRKRTIGFCQELRKLGVKATFELEWGDPASEILRAARDAHLVAMTTHGFGGFKRWVFGSVAEKVIREARVPVFVHRTAGVPKKTEKLAKSTIVIS